jgi:hypothetical protein
MAVTTAGEPRRNHTMTRISALLAAAAVLGLAAFSGTASATPPPGCAARPSLQRRRLLNDAATLNP